MDESVIVAEFKATTKDDFLRHYGNLNKEKWDEKLRIEKESLLKKAKTRAITRELDKKNKREEEERKRQGKERGKSADKIKQKETVSCDDAQKPDKGASAGKEDKRPEDSRIIEARKKEVEELIKVVQKSEYCDEEVVSNLKEIFDNPIMQRADRRSWEVWRHDKLQDAALALAERKQKQIKDQESRDMASMEKRLKEAPKEVAAIAELLEEQRKLQERYQMKSTDAGRLAYEINNSDEISLEAIRKYCQDLQNL